MRMGRRQRERKRISRDAAVLRDNKPIPINGSGAWRVRDRKRSNSWIGFAMGGAY